ncbi:MAG: L-aspartate oxidase [Candidatus Portiera sp.]|nr:L-aspartate oxidase [Portiera sp.]
MKLYDVLIIGMGAAGMQLSLRLAAQGYKIGILCKGELMESATYWAQGGIAVPFAVDDSPAQHINDTLVAGDGLCNPKVVKFIVDNSVPAVKELLNMDFPVTRNKADGQPDLGREGGHSTRRIVHASDHTGKALSTTLINAIKKSKNITIHSNNLAIDLIVKRGKCVGCYALDIKKNRTITYAGKSNVLATGGASWVYQYSTSPQSATGDGIAMAARAGCRLANMEFTQFHPTQLYHPQVKSFLISEALRGEGAKLVLKNGSRFMDKFDKRAELAPRDVVARGIDFIMKKRGLDFVYLDISHKPSAFIKKRFPNTYKQCRDLGMDLTRQPIPVIPAAHYTCGGVVTDTAGVTDIKGLYALGETAHNGLHGANRLASNSLLECLVMAHSAAEHIHQNIANIKQPDSLPPWDESRVVNSDEDVVISHNWDELRRFMWNYVGIVRTNKRLERALRRVQLLKEEVREYYSNYRVSRDLLELRNLLTCAELIIRSARMRKESRGLHYNTDYLNKSTKPRNNIITY